MIRRVAILVFAAVPISFSIGAQEPGVSDCRSMASAPPASEELIRVVQWAGELEGALPREAENCFTALDGRDQHLLDEIFLGMKQACEGRASTDELCRLAQEKFFQERIQSYKSDRGTPAAQRVMTVLIAQAHRQKAHAALAWLEENGAGPAFEVFFQRLKEFDNALFRAFYQDIQASLPTESRWRTLEDASVKMKRYGLALRDSLEVQFGRTNGKATDNRRRELLRAGDSMKLAKEHLAFLLRKSAMEPEKRERILGYLNEVETDARLRIRQASLEVEEINQRIKFGSGVGFSVGLLTLSGGTLFGGLAPAGVSGGLQGVLATLAAQAGNAAASAALGTGGTLALINAAEMGGTALVDSYFNETRFFCELSQQVSKKFDLALVQSLQAAREAANLATGMGVGMGVMGLSNSTVPLTISVGKQVLKVNKLTRELATEARLAREQFRRVQQVRDQVKTGKSGKGEYTDELHAVSRDGVPRAIRAIKNVNDVTGASQGLLQKGGQLTEKVLEP